jgi:hypothetical protein
VLATYVISNFVLFHIDDKELWADVIKPTFLLCIYTSSPTNLVLLMQYLDDVNSYPSVQFSSLLNMLNLYADHEISSRAHVFYYLW